MKTICEITETTSSQNTANVNKEDAPQRIVQKRCQSLWEDKKFILALIIIALISIAIVAVIIVITVQNNEGKIFKE